MPPAYKCCAGRMPGAHREGAAPVPRDRRPLLLSDAERDRQLEGLVGNAHLLQNAHRPVPALVVLKDTAEIHGQQYILEDGRLSGS